MMMMMIEPVFIGFVGAVWYKVTVNIAPDGQKPPYQDYKFN
jgi:hypothetical protein